MKIRNYIALLFCAVLIIACDKDFSERTSYDGEDSFRFSSPSTTVLENADTVSIPVFFTTSSSTTGTVNVVVSSTDLEEGVDFSVISPATLTIGPDSGFSAMVQIILVDNSDITPASRELELTLSNPSVGDVGNSGPDNINSSHTIIVNEDDCASELGGTFDFVSMSLVAENSNTADGCPSGSVTGTVTFTDMGGGTYLVSDLGFGQYESTCWNDGPATSEAALFTDICGEITSGGIDQYGLIYDWVITGVSGANLSLSWTNNYADSGNTVITRTDGTDWPVIFTP